MQQDTERDRNVVVQVGNSFTAFCSSPYVCTWALNDEEKKKLLDDEDMMFFYDPGDTKTPLGAQVRAFTIVCASMDPQNYRCLSKSNSYTLYMPVWSLEELSACASLYHCSNTVVEESYKKWGGSPRSIFDVKHEKLHLILNEILQSKALENIVADVQGVEVSTTPGWSTHLFTTMTTPSAL